MEKKEIRFWVASLVRASGCSCCRDDDKWNESLKSLAKLLNVPKYNDGSGFNFHKFTKD